MSSKNKDNNNNFYGNEISSQDLISLNLLTLQLKGILLNYFGNSLLWNSTIQGIQHVLEKYDSIEGNEHDSNLTPDLIALQSYYISLVAKIISLYIAFTRYNVVSEMKVNGDFNFSLQPNIYINTANVLNIIVSYYYIRALQGIILDRDIQPIFGI